MRTAPRVWQQAWASVGDRRVPGWARSRGRDLFGYEVWEFYDDQHAVYLEVVLRSQLIFATEEPCPIPGT